MRKQYPVLPFWHCTKTWQASIRSTYTQKHTTNNHLMSDLVRGKSHQPFRSFSWLSRKEGWFHGIINSLSVTMRYLRKFFKKNFHVEGNLKTIQGLACAGAAVNGGGCRTGNCGARHSRDAALACERLHRGSHGSCRFFRTGYVYTTVHNWAGRRKQCRSRQQQAYNPRIAS